MFKAFDINIEEVDNACPYEFPVKTRSELVKVMSTPSLKKAYIRHLDFTGYAPTRAVHTAMCRIVGNFTPLAVQLYTNP